ncbi:MAG TPA: phage tail protein [Propionibacteriaceae bacterium]|nr:phage tail protein [Propionibacteriaceae bacterium]
MTIPRQRLTGGPPVADAPPITSEPPSVPPVRRQRTPAPHATELRERREIVISDTAEGYCIPILLGRFRLTCRIVHFDLVSQARLDIVALVGHGELEGIDSVEFEDTEVYASSVPWCQCQVRLGTTTQTPVTNIAHSSWASALPGLAYVALRIRTQTAPLHGGLPRIVVRGRGVKLANPGGAASWSENPARMVYHLLTDSVYGAGIPAANVDGTLPTLDDPAGIIDYTSLEYIGQTGEDSEAGGGDYDRSQSFVMPCRNVVIMVKVRFAPSGGTPSSYTFPCELRATQDGSAITPAAVETTAGGAGTYTVRAWFGQDLGGSTALVPGSTYYLVLPKTGDGAYYYWKLNTATNAYAGGKAQLKSGSWVDVSYDHWFKVAYAERPYRASLIIDQRQPVENVISDLLRVFHGRLAWYDDAWHILADWAGSSIGTISDRDNADIPICAGSLRVERRDAAVPNTCIVTYRDTEDWTEREVRYDAAGVLDGTEQPRELRIRALTVPSGGQAYRLAKTWLTRARRTWTASCRVPQDGIEAALCDRVTLDTMLYSAPVTCLVNGITDGPDGTFDLDLVPYVAGDFATDAYLPESPVDTTMVRDLEAVIFEDEFLTGGTADGEIGDLRWSLTIGSGVMPPSYTTATMHPGIVILSGGKSGGVGATTIELDGEAQKFARAGNWYIKWIARANLTQTTASDLAILRATSVIRLRWYGPTGDLELSTTSGSSYSTLQAITANDWVTFEVSCDGSTAAYDVCVGETHYTGSVAMSGSTPDQTMYAYVSGSATANSALLYIDRAKLTMLVDR